MKNVVVRKVLSVALIVSLIIASHVSAAENSVSDDEQDIHEKSYGYQCMPWDRDVEMTDEDISFAEALDRVVDEDSPDSEYHNVKITDYSPRADIPAKYPENGESDLDALQTYLEDKYPATRNQNPFGTCWSFATMANAEFTQINKGGAAKNINYSEMNLAYGIYRTRTNPVVGNDDAAGGVSFNGTDTEMLNNGGNFRFASQYLSRGFGFVNESDQPYVYSYDQIDTIEDVENCYPDKVVSHLSNSYAVDIKRDNGRNIVKEAIMQNGIVSILFYHDDAYYNSAGNSYFNYSNTNSNHAVCIVGWDDSFAVDNFDVDHRPQNPGAWLIRNSWGEESTDFYSIYKYFWMSYEDVGIQNAAYIFDITNDTAAYDNNYYYDTQMHKDARVSVGSTVANVFKVPEGKNEKLTEISFEVLDNNDYEAKIYTDLTDMSDPESGELCATLSGTLSFPGIYTIPVSDSIILEGGTAFSVVVTTNNSSVVIELGFQLVNAIVTCGMKEGQSFLKDEVWKDSSDILSSGYGNFCISAHTKNIGDILTADKFTFSAPASLAYDGNPHPASVTAKSGIDAGRITVYYGDEQGNFTTSAPVNLGKYKVKIKADGSDAYDGRRGITSSSWTFSIVKGGQDAVVISDPGTKIYGDPKFGLEVSGGSGTGEYVFSSDDESILSVDAEGQVTINGAGSATISVYRRGDENYVDSGLTRKLIEIGKADQAAVTLSGDTVKKREDSQFKVTASGGSGSGSFHYYSSDTSVLTVDDEGIVTIRGAGSAEIIAYKEGDDNYHDAERATLTINVLNEAQAPLTVENVTGKKYGSGGFMLSASGGSGTGSFIFESLTEDILSVSQNGWATINKPGIATVKVYREADQDYAESDSETFTVTIEKGEIVITANDVWVACNDEMPEFSYHVSGMDMRDSFTKDPVIKCSAADTSTAGTYDIDISGAEVDNEDYYEGISYVSGVLTISDGESERSERQDSEEKVIVKDPSGKEVLLIHDSGDNTYRTTDGKEVLVVSSSDGSQDGEARYQYTGKKITPGKDSYVVYNGVIYSYGSDYKVSYRKNKKKGSATAIVRWKKGSVPFLSGVKKTSETFTILPRTVSDNMVSIYLNGKGAVRKVTVDVNGRIIKATKRDYSCTGSASEGFIIKFKNNFTGEVNKKYEMI